MTLETQKDLIERVSRKIVNKIIIEELDLLILEELALEETTMHTPGVIKKVTEEIQQQLRHIRQRIEELLDIEHTSTHAGSRVIFLTARALNRHRDAPRYNGRPTLEAVIRWVSEQQPNITVEERPEAFITECRKIVAGRKRAVALLVNVPSQGGRYSFLIETHDRRRLRLAHDAYMKAESDVLKTERSGIYTSENVTRLFSQTRLRAS